MSGTLEYYVQFSSDVSAKANCLERLLEYAEGDVEPPAKLDSDDALVQAGWPTQGRVVFKDLDMRCVLSGVCGVCGVLLTPHKLSLGPPATAPACRWC